MNALVTTLTNEAKKTPQIIESAQAVANCLFKITSDIIFARESPASADDMTRLINESRNIIAQSALDPEVKKLLEKKSDIDLQRTFRDVYLSFLRMDKGPTRV
jgi:hypothetical protein